MTKEGGGNRLIVTRRGEATVFTIPPAGYRLPGLFVALLGGLFLLASLAHVWYFLDSWRGSVPQGAGYIPTGWFALLLFLCWFNGLGLIAVTLLHASRRATLSVRAGALRIVEASVLREKVIEWPPGEVVSVTAVGATLKIGRPDAEVFTWAGVPQPGAWVSEGEMCWLASELDLALGLGSAKARR